jgi:hypothetical protein
MPQLGAVRFFGGGGIAFALWVVSNRFGAAVA